MMSLSNRIIFNTIAAVILATPLIVGVVVYIVKSNISNRNDIAKQQEVKKIQEINRKMRLILYDKFRLLDSDSTTAKILARETWGIMSQEIDMILEDR